MAGDLPRVTSPRQSPDAAGRASTPALPACSRASAATTGDGRVVVLGVAASDSHAVANQLIAADLSSRGFRVVNLGVCSPLAEFAEALRRQPGAEALLIGSLNGHAVDDLAELPSYRRRGLIRCPVILGGNLSVGGADVRLAAERLHALGVDWILRDAERLPRLLNVLAARRRAAPSGRGRAA